MREITVTIARGSATAHYTSVYTLPADTSLSVLNVLDYIYEHLDSTLAYFSHEACRQTACGKCLVRVNGQVCLACGRVVEEDTLLLEPWNANPVRDLICMNIQGGVTHA